MVVLEFPQVTDRGHVPPCDECRRPLNIVVEFGYGFILCADCAAVKWGWTTVKAQPIKEAP